MNWTRFIIRTQQDIEDMQIRYRKPKRRLQAPLQPKSQNQRL